MNAEHAAKPYRRSLRNFLIYPGFQLGLLGVQALVMVATFVFMQLENRAAFTALEAMGKDAALPAGHPYFQVDPLRFRNWDFYRDLPAVVNQAISRVRRDRDGHA